MSAEAIHVLMPKVMADIGVIGKGRTNTHQGFKFRGIDDVMNALHEPLTKHGVFYVPEVLESEYHSYTTSNGTGMRNCVLKVKYTFYGPAGDSISGVGMGEASDSGDKATSKALAMALKYALLQTFCIPTEEQGAEDPDGQVHQRAGAWSDNGPACPKCGTDVWDNTQDPKRGKRPKWKCKDQNCDWASWDDDPFQDSQAPPPTGPAESPENGTGTSHEVPQPEGTPNPPSGSPPWLRALQKAYPDDAIVSAAENVRKELGTGSPITALSGVYGATEEIQQKIGALLAEGDWNAKAGAK